MPEAIGNNAAQKLRSPVDRIERLEADKRDIAEDIREIYKEAKSAGYDVPVLRKLIGERRKDVAKREEQESLLDVYRRALGDYGSTELGKATLERVA